MLPDNYGPFHIVKRGHSNLIRIMHCDFVRLLAKITPSIVALSLPPSHIHFFQVQTISTKLDTHREEADKIAKLLRDCARTHSFVHQLKSLLATVDSFLAKCDVSVHEQHS